MSIRDNLGGGSAGSVLDTLEEIEANTEAGKAAGALAVKELNDSLNKTISADNYIEIENNWVATESGIVVAKSAGAANALLRLSRNGIFVSSVGTGYNSYGLETSSPVVEGDLVEYSMYGCTIDSFVFYPYQ